MYISDKNAKELNLKIYLYEDIYNAKNNFFNSAKEMINSNLFKFSYCKSCKKKSDIYRLILKDEDYNCDCDKSKINWYFYYNGKNKDLFKYDSFHLWNFSYKKIKNLNFNNLNSRTINSDCQYTRNTRYTKIIIASEDPTKINQTFKNELFNFFGKTNINKFEEKIYLTKESKELHCYSIILNKRFHLSENDFEDLINKYQSNYYSNDSYWKFNQRKNNDLRYEIIYLDTLNDNC